MLEDQIHNQNIRPYKEEDEKAVLSILKEPGGHYFDKDNVDFGGFSEAYVFENEGDIKGFICLDISEKISQIICYVAPSHRRHGIGGKLFEFGRQRLASADPNTVWIFFRNDVGESAAFYKNRGALPWYSYHYMVYDNPQDALNNNFASFQLDTVVKYNPKYFDEYLEGRSRAFLEINRLINSQPYDERERKADIQKWAEQNEKDLWLFFSEERLVGSIAVFEGFFDEVFVVPEFQHKGVGTAIVLWALKYCFSKGWNPSLCVVTRNQPAINLYKRAGFKVVQTLEMNRIFNPHKEPDMRGPVG